MTRRQIALVSLLGLGLVSTSFALPAKNKYVTILYETWADGWLQTATCTLPDAYETGCTGADALVSTCPHTSFHHWGASALFGGDTSQYRFVLTDGGPNTALIDNHADLLADAGVDFITIDYSNDNISNPTNNNSTLALLNRYTHRLDAGTPTPKIVFLTGADPDGGQDTNLYNKFYSPYPAGLFFYVGTKPFHLSTLACGSSPNFSCKQMGGMIWAPTLWSWKEATPQPIFMNYSWPEAVPVSPAYQNFHMNDCGMPMESQPKGRDAGMTFDDQWSQVSNSNPSFVFVNGWNEWGAMNINPGNNVLPPYAHDRPLLTDQWNQEYSSDIEPMQGGHGTLYYDRMKSKIANFKRNVPNFAMRNSSEGSWTLKYYSGADSLAVANFTTALSWTSGTNLQPIVGDFDNDGHMDIGVRNSSTGVWSFARRTGAYTFSSVYTFNWASGSHYQAIVGDFDNDGHTDIGLRDTTSAGNGTWHFALWTSAYTYAETGSSSFSWAPGSNYTPFVGDFDGDGHTDIGLRDANNGRWYLAQRTGSFSYSNYLNFDWASGSQYQAFVGDWDSDGLVDIGLRNTTDGYIYLLNNSSVFSFGNQEMYRGPNGTNREILALPNLPAGP